MKIPILIDDESLLPQYMTEGAAGADVRACLERATFIHPRERVLINTGIRVKIPVGYEIQVRPRSGLALRHGITVLNSPGTIDSDYTGEIRVILINHGNRVIPITPGMRIGQLVVNRVVQADWQICSDLPDTVRGQQGFGSTKHD